ncbi:MAG: 4a-hydroxytetrahydrobiopterin dehydratase [Bacteroidota bacterium]|nr:4a-hydroxytetrahydrobiopterin dehydratase [Bacteroidota bacterium]
MWTEENNKLVREFKFKDFSEAWAFLSRVALLAESHQHHPEIRNSYNTVTLELQTHDSGDKVTEKDREMSKIIDKWF